MTGSYLGAFIVLGIIIVLGTGIFRWGTAPASSDSTTTPRSLGSESTD